MRNEREREEDVEYHNNNESKKCIRHDNVLYIISSTLAEKKITTKLYAIDVISY